MNEKEDGNENKQPLSLVVDTMPGRELRTTYVDQKVYESSTGFYGQYPHSSAGKREMMELPY